jgi:hypothetical protein
MHIVAGTFTSQEEALSALHDLEKQGVAPVRMNVIQSGDRKGFEREHRSMGKAAFWGAVTGAVFGVTICGILLWIAGVNILALRYIALYLGGIAISTVGGAGVFALWNMGDSHDEALLYEEARETRAVIAAVEVDDPMEDRVMLALEKHGAHDIRSGMWRPQGWEHSHPGDAAA